MTGQQILNYRIEKLIGEGGMGNVFLAKHSHIGRDVAIKALNPSLVRNPEIRERFKNEASMLSQLHHPGIVALFDYVEQENGLFLIMEYAAGTQMDEYITKITGPIPEEKTIKLFDAILDAVAYAHKKNVVHRDIKPSNIIVNTDNKIKILDFGIARIIGDSNRKLTKTGTKLGTVLYMSPEQVQGLELDYRTDIYSLGITLFQMLTGRGPYDESSTEYEVYKRIVEEPLPDARSYYPGISDKMIAIINKATNKDISKRFQSCEEFRQAVNSAYFDDKPIISGKAKEKKNKASKIKKKPKKRNGFFMFWNIIIPVLLMLATGLATWNIFFIKDTRYVIAWKLYLRNSKSNNDNTNIIKILEYGDNVNILNIDKSADNNGYIWAEIRDNTGEKGYVALNYLAKENEYYNINQIFCTDELRKSGTSLKYALFSYYTVQSMFDNQGNITWKILPENTVPGYFSICQGDFNNDNITDYACIIENLNENRYRFLAFTGGQAVESENFHEEELYKEAGIRIMHKGEKIYTGKTTTEYNINFWGDITTVEKKVYEPLKSDAILLKYKSGNKKYLYIFNTSNNSFNKPAEYK